ncbi:MAG: 30S ribosome-binding factor RbfA [Desulfobaccales bacterium]
MPPRLVSGRSRRAAELLRERLALILLHKCADPRLRELTLTRVEMSPDLKQARVFYAAHLDADPETLRRALDRALRFIKQEVARENLFRLLPQISFLPDTGPDQVTRIEELLREAGISSKSGGPAKE